MIRIVTPGEMADLDALAMKEGEIPGIVLMENAAFGVTQVVLETMAGFNGTVVILAGIGNNGGDGFCVAKQLAMQNINPIVYLVGKEEKLKGDALTNWKIISKRNDITLKKISSKEPKNTEELKDLKTDLAHAKVIVDALLGTGIKGEIREPIASVMDAINKSRKKFAKPVISVDIPSGVMGEDGQVAKKTVKADKTVTFALPKYGHFIHPGKEYRGELSLCPIGITDEIIEAYFSSQGKKGSKFVEAKDVCEELPKRKSNYHKGNFGRLLIIAGSRGMLGASYLTSNGAMRSGGGLVTVASPESEQRYLQTKSTEIMTLPLSSEDGIFSENAAKEVGKLLDDYDGVAIGPGIRDTASTYQLVKKVIEDFKGPLVIDADGLNVLSRDDGKLLNEVLPAREVPAVLTPHPGEFVRLSGKSMKEVLTNPVKLVKEMSSRWGVYLVLKGAPNFISTPDGDLFLIDKGNPGMATGGTGDVLTGVLVSLQTQKILEDNISLPTEERILEALLLGVYLHGISGDIAVEEVGMEGLAASDLCFHLAYGIKELNKTKSIKKERRIPKKCRPKIL